MVVIDLEWNWILKFFFSFLKLTMCLIMEMSFN